MRRFSLSVRLSVCLLVGRSVGWSRGFVGCNKNKIYYNGAVVIVTNAIKIVIRVWHLLRGGRRQNGRHRVIVAGLLDGGANDLAKTARV